jgi:hypothetical protein
MSQDPRNRIKSDATYREEQFRIARDYFESNPSIIKYSRKTPDSPDLSFIRCGGSDQRNWTFYCLTGHSVREPDGELTRGGETERVKRGIDEHGNSVFIRRVNREGEASLLPSNPGVAATRAYFGTERVGASAGQSSDASKPRRCYQTLPDCGQDWFNWIDTNRIGDSRPESKLQRLLIGYSLLYLFQQALTELNHLHDLGYLHRDIKPENLTIQPPTDGGLASVRLIDLNYAVVKPTSGELVTDDYTGTAGFLPNWAKRSKTEFIYSIHTDLYALAHCFWRDCRLNERDDAASAYELTNFHGLLARMRDQANRYNGQQYLTEAETMLTAAAQAIATELSNDQSTFPRLSFTQQLQFVRETQATGLCPTAGFAQLFKTSLLSYQNQLQQARDGRTSAWVGIGIALVLSGGLLFGVALAYHEKSKRIDAKLNALNGVSADTTADAAMQTLSNLDENADPRIFAGRNSRMRSLSQIASQRVAAA